MERTYYTIEDRYDLPENPGVYQFYDAGERCLYVGKAKNLRKRVGSYFTAQAMRHIKTRKMVGRARKIAFTIVNNEYEALLLENNLIKEWQPLYNVLLKDDRSYPYLCITDERFPRLMVTRQRTPSLGSYFGPFTSGRVLAEVEELVRDLYPLRTCGLNLSERNIRRGKFRVCLAYHLGNCLGPCVGKQREEAYAQDIEEAKQLLRGNFGAVKRGLKKRMVAAAEVLAFEEAQRYKEKLLALERYQARSLITDARGGTLDVVAMVDGDDCAFASYLYLQEGRVAFAASITLRRLLDEDSEELMARVLVHFRGIVGSEAEVVLANLPTAPLPAGVVLTIPKVGEKKRLIELALKNALFYKKEALHKQGQEKEKRTSRTVLMQLQQDLRMREVPMHIECFDNSHLQGTHPVASMVCFKKGKPAKRAYRHYHITSTAFADDYAFMREVIHRRYHRLLEEGAALPDLIVVDGGKGQLNTAVEVLKALGLYGKMAIISIAKRLEAIYFPNDPQPCYISKRSPSLRLLQQIRNEAHRLAITFHRDTRGKYALQSMLATLPGIGPKSLEALLHTFGSLEGVQKAEKEALVGCIGASRAAKVWQWIINEARPQD